MIVGISTPLLPMGNTKFFSNVNDEQLDHVYIILKVFSEVCNKWHQQLWRRKLEDWEVSKVCSYIQGIPLNYSLNSEALRALIVVRYYLDKNSTKTKSSKGCRSGKPSLTMEGAMILCIQWADLSFFLL